MKILLAVDGSEGALEAVHHALSLVHAGLKASFVLANVQEPASLYEVVTAHNAEVLEQVSAAAGAHALAAAEQLLRSAGVEFEREIASGDPGHALVDIAERFECDLIMLGRRAAGALGAVATSVLHGASMPVLVAGSVDA